MHAASERVVNWREATGTRAVHDGLENNADTKKRAVKTAPGGPAGHDVRLRGQGCVPTRVGGFCGGTPSRRGFNRPRHPLAKGNFCIGHKR